jgi:hypothetical protein
MGDDQNEPTAAEVADAAEDAGIVDQQAKAAAEVEAEVEADTDEQDAAEGEPPVAIP